MFQLSSTNKVQYFFIICHIVFPQTGNYVQFRFKYNFHFIELCILNFKNHMKKCASL